MKGPMLGLRTVAYKVPDLTKAKEWYADAFQTKPYFDEPFYVGFNIGGYELGLMPEEELVGVRSDNAVIYWGVEDIHHEYKRLIELGATVQEVPTNVGGDLIVASVRDPWGNVVGIIYNPDFKLE
ncbi:VOC family protein [Bacteroidota bacterium]